MKNFLFFKKKPHQLKVSKEPVYHVKTVGLWEMIVNATVCHFILVNIVK